MDETRSSAPGHVEATPEAEPFDPAASPAPPVPATTSSTGPGAQSGAPQDRVGEMGRDLGQRLKPVAVAAEGVAAKAVDLSTKGLNRLAAILRERRQRRDGGQG